MTETPHTDATDPELVPLVYDDLWEWLAEHGVDAELAHCMRSVHLDVATTGQVVAVIEYLPPEEAPMASRVADVYTRRDYFPLWQPIS